MAYIYIREKHQDIPQLFRHLPEYLGKLWGVMVNTQKIWGLFWYLFLYLVLNYDTYTFYFESIF